MNKLFTDLGGKFKCFAQDSDLEYSFWRSKNLPVSSDLKPPLGSNQMLFTSGKNTEFLKGCAIFHKIPTLRLHFTFHTISKHKSCNISFEQTDVKWAFAKIYHRLR